MSRRSYLYIAVEWQTRAAENSRPPSNSMTTNETMDSGSNVTAFNVLSGFPEMSLFDDLESLRSLADSALAASGALGTIDTPAFHDAVSSVGGITASINAVTDFEQSIETFGGPSALAGAADIFALNTLNSFETATSPFLVGIDAEMEELANQTAFAPLFSNDSVSRLALLTTDYDLFGALPSHEEYTKSPVDRDFQWSFAKYTYHSLKLYLEQLEISIDDKLAMDLFFFSYWLVFLHVYTPFTLSIDTILAFIASEVWRKLRNRD